jgi:hypothetical protein
VTPSGLEPATFRLVAQCPNQLRYQRRAPKSPGTFLNNSKIPKPGLETKNCTIFQLDNGKKKNTMKQRKKKERTKERKKEAATAVKNVCSL